MLNLCKNPAARTAAFLLRGDDVCWHNYLKTKAESQIIVQSAPNYSFSCQVWSCWWVWIIFLLLEIQN